MKGAGEFARRAFERMGGGEESSEGGENATPKASVPSASAVAGKRFAKAVHSGDGQAIADAFKALKSATDTEGMSYESE